MSSVIQLLPDSVANQIAAGEVVQRPASVVKELMENSVDAGSSIIRVIVRDGGKALIQVIDNGSGMSETDARLCFERHATSKIREAADLFSIRTMGFRGEALASIAAVAEVELRTRQEGEQLGTGICISGSEIVSHDPLATPQGTSISVKNLFFNIPARRKFLKSSSLELKHIISEFQRVALANPEITMSLSHNGADIYNISPGGVKQRVVSLMGKNLKQHLLDISTKTSVVRISGFIGGPQSAKKSPGEQFFFVNQRYMKSPYLNKAVIKGYEKILQPDSIPPYFIFFEVNPDTIDVNIHPTKTEIKFEDERVVWQILHAAVRETLGKFAVVPSIDFDTEMVIDIPFFPKSAPVSPPELDINHAFNPFDSDSPKLPKHSSGKYQKPSVDGWHELFHQHRGDGFEDFNLERTQQTVTKEWDEHQDLTPKPSQRFFQFKNRFILTSVKSGLMVIDQRRAHERILYDESIKSITNTPSVTQQELFPQIIDLNPGDYSLLMEIKDTLNGMGVELSDMGQNSISVQALPANLKVTNANQLIADLLASFKENASCPTNNASERMAISLAKASAIPYNRPLDPLEMQELVDKLFASHQPNLTPDGKPIISIIEMNDFEKRFK